MTGPLEPLDPQTWPGRVDELAACHADVVAISTTANGGEVLTWGELAARSRDVASHLIDRGVGPGAVVCLEVPNCVAHVVCTIGAWRLGATVLPLRAGLPSAERDRLSDLANPVVIVVDRPAETEPEAYTEDLMSPSGRQLPGDQSAVEVADPAWLIASGGSTGAPKLISPSTTTTWASGAASQSRGVAPTFVESDHHRHPVHLVCSPLYHAQGFAVLHHTLLADYRNVILARFDAETVLDLIEDERVALVVFVPTMLIRLLRSPTIRDRDLSSLERVMQGGGACPEWVVRSWIDLVGPERFVMGYGSSEGVCSAQITGDEWLLHPGSVGRPIGADVLVVDDHGHAVASGEVGELYFRPIEAGRGVRYLGPAHARTLPGGYLSIGDLGRVDDQGYLYIADRRTDMVVSGGANVFVSEVEAVLLMHPDVVDAAVIGLPDPEWGRRVHGILQVSSGVSGEGLLTSIRSFCKVHLAAYKVPRTFELVTSLGRADSGKLNRRSLAEARETAQRDGLDSALANNTRDG